MENYIIFILFLCVYTFFLKRKFKMKFLDEWSKTQVDSKALLYSIPALVVLVSFFSTFIVIKTYKYLIGL